MKIKIEKLKILKIIKKNYLRKWDRLLERIDIKQQKIHDRIFNNR